MYKIIKNLDFYLRDINGLIALIAGMVAASLIFSLFISYVHNFIRYSILYRFGDYSVKGKGYLRFKPKRVFHAIGFISALTLNISFAQPLKYTERKLRTPKLALFLSSITGPVSYFLFSLISLFIYLALIQFNPFGIISGYNPPVDAKWNTYVYFFFCAMMYYLTITCMSSAIVSIIPVLPCSLGEFSISLFSRNISEALRNNELILSVGVFIFLFLTIGAPNGLIIDTADKVLGYFIEPFKNLLS